MMEIPGHQDFLASDSRDSHPHIDNHRHDIFTGTISPDALHRYHQFLDSSPASECTVRYDNRSIQVICLSRLAGLSIAFGIAGSVFIGACGAAFKYISGKVEEERTKLAKDCQESNHS